MGAGSLILGSTVLVQVEGVAATGVGAVSIFGVTDRGAGSVDFIGAGAGAGGFNELRELST